MENEQKNIPKSTVVMQYRDYVPFDVIAVHYTHVDIQNDDSLEEDYLNERGEILDECHNESTKLREEHTRLLEKQKLWERESIWNIIGFKEFPEKDKLERVESAIKSEDLPKDISFDERYFMHTELKSRGYILHSKTSLSDTVTNEIWYKY